MCGYLSCLQAAPARVKGCGVVMKEVVNLVTYPFPLANGQIVGGGGDLTVPQYYAAGSLAAIPISLVEAPVDLFKIKLQAQVKAG